jgi:mannosyltransferase
MNTKSAHISGSWWVGVIAITAIGMAFRVTGIEVHSFWYDEAVTQEIIKRPVSEMVAGVARDNGNPPLYWIVARTWQHLIGDGDARLRAASVLFGVLTIPFMALLGRRLASPAVGIIAGLLFAVSPLELEFAHEARAYSLLHFVTLLNAWLFHRWLTGRRAADWIGYSLTMFLAWYTHYYAAFLPLAHGTVLIAVGRDRRVWTAWIGAMFTSALPFLAWLPSFVTQLTMPGNLTRLSDGWKLQFPATPITFALGRTFAWRDSPTWLLALAGVGSLFGFHLPLIVGAWRARKDSIAFYYLLSWLLLPVLIPLVVAVLGKPLYSHRYAAIGLPAFLVLVSWGLVAMTMPWRALVGFVAIVMTATSLGRYYTEPLKDDWRSATPIITAKHPPSELLVFDTGIEVISFFHYIGAAKPSAVIGLDLIQNDTRLHGVMYRDGTRDDWVARDYTDEIYGRQRVCLVLCVPARPTDAHLIDFGKRGFDLVGSAKYHRIRVYWFASRSAVNNSLE